MPTRLHCHSSGDLAAPPVLLLHGFFSDGRMWHQPLAALTALGISRHWLALDLPGHGRSQGLRPPSEQQAWPWLWRLLDEVVTDLGQSPIIIGYSFGARVAAAWALAHCSGQNRPQLAGMVLESAHCGLPAPEAAQRRLADQHLAGQLENASIDASIADWQAQPLFASQTHLPVERAADLAAHQGLRREQSPTGLGFALRNLGTGTMPDLQTCPPRADLPSLVLTGDLDPKFVAMLPLWSMLLPQAQLATLPGVGHHICLENPQLWAQTVAPFLDPCSRG